jgi:pyridoxine kinase
VSSSAHAPLTRLLADTKISNIDQLCAAMAGLHAKHGLKHIAVSSMVLPKRPVPDLPAFPANYPGTDTDSPDMLVCIAGSEDGEIWGFALPTIEGYFSGVGDL